MYYMCEQLNRMGFLINRTEKLHFFQIRIVFFPDKDCCSLCVSEMLHVKLCFMSDVASCVKVWAGNNVQYELLHFFQIRICIF